MDVLECRLQDAEKARENQEAIVSWTTNSEANVQETKDDTYWVPCKLERVGKSKKLRN